MLEFLKKNPKHQKAYFFSDLTTKLGLEPDMNNCFRERRRKTYESKVVDWWNTYMYMCIYIYIHYIYIYIFIYVKISFYYYWLTEAARSVFRRRSPPPYSLR